MRVRFTAARVLLLAVGLSIGSAACGQYSISNIRALKAFKEANELYRKGDYKNAIDSYERALQYNPDFWGITYFFIGNSYDQLYKPAKKGQPENDAYIQKAVDNYKLAIQKIKDTDQEGPKFRKLAREWLVAAYGVNKLNDVSQAEPVVRELIANNPDEPSNYLAMGNLYEEVGRVEEAEAQFKKAIEVKPNDPSVYESLAGFYNRQGKFELTIDAFQQRANLEPSNPEAWHVIGSYYQDKIFQEEKFKPKRIKDAVLRDYAIKGIAAEDKALAINPNYYEAVTFKNILLRMQAAYEKDPAYQKRLIAEADVLYARALELQKSQGAAADAKKSGGK